MPSLILMFIGFFVGVTYAGISRNNSIKPILGLATLGLVIGLALSTVRIVPAGYVGIVDLFGNVSSQALKSGVNFVNPFAKVVFLSVRTREDKETMSVPSKEGMNISLDISVLYRLDPNKTVEIYRTIGENYRDVILHPQFRAAARGVTVGHEAKSLYTSEREMLATAIEDSLKGMVADRGVIVERILLRSIVLPPTLTVAIEQKLKAEQEAERMKFILQKESQEAERKRVEAKGIRDAQEIINQSLTAQYLNYLWINTLNQNPNVIYVATEANMPMYRSVNPEWQNANKKPLTPPDATK